MSQARCNARRRKQAANKFSHLAPHQRPKYKIKDASASARHLQKVIEGERRRSQKRG